MDGLAGRVVLLLEDNFVLALALEHRLAELGLRVLGPFATVADAHVALERDPVDLAILDIQVRGGTSLDFGHELQQRGVPFMFLTGYGARYELPAKLAGVAKLDKPVDERLLRITIERL